MAREKKNKKNSTRLALYFGSLIIFIILVSTVFKAVDLFRSSKFDGKNRFTVALINPDRIDVLSVSPSESKISRLTLENTSFSERLKDYQIPYDTVVTSKTELVGSPKKQFAGLLFHKRSLKGKLTLPDVLVLWLTTRSIPEENVEDESVKFNETDRAEDLSSLLFQDPKIVEEELTITVTNTTQKPGLGNRVADYATNLGGRVILVNSSRDEEKRSRIYYKNPSYTVTKLSRILGIPTEKKESNSISDIIISIGADY